MTSLYVAYSAATSAAATLGEIDDFEKFHLGLLVSFVYTKDFHRRRTAWKSQPTRTILDSGAYSAWNSGYSIDIDQLIEEARNQAVNWSEVIALDVIGDGKQSLKNALYMKDKGLHVIPVFHIGEPFGLLRDYCAAFDRVGLSCRFGEKVSESFKWLDHCFAAVYPHRFHSFGWTKETMLLNFPFDTADSSSWVRPLKFGLYNEHGTQPYRNNSATLHTELAFYARMQRQLRLRWANEIKKGYIGELSHLQINL